MLNHHNTSLLFLLFGGFLDDVELKAENQVSFELKVSSVQYNDSHTSHLFYWIPTTISAQTL